MAQYGKSIPGVVSRLSDADARRQHAQYRPGGKLHMRWHPGSPPADSLESGAVDPYGNKIRALKGGGEAAEQMKELLSGK